MPAVPWNCSPRRASRRRPGGPWAIPAPTTPWLTGCTTTTIDVKHVDVRPADGVPVKPYEVLTAADLGLAEDVIHDDAGGAFLRSWREALGS